MNHAIISCYRNHYNETFGWGIVRVLSPALLSPKKKKKKIHYHTGIIIGCDSDGPTPLHVSSQILDPTCCGVRLASSLALATAVATGEEGDEDVQEGDDSVDDGGQDGANAVDNGHQDAADGLEAALNL